MPIIAPSKWSLLVILLVSHNITDNWRRDNGENTQRLGRTILRHFIYISRKFLEKLLNMSRAYLYFDSNNHYAFGL